MSKNDRMLLVILSAIILNTKAFYMSASAKTDSNADNSVSCSHSREVSLTSENASDEISDNGSKIYMGAEFVSLFASDADETKSFTPDVSRSNDVSEDTTCVLNKTALKGLYHDGDDVYYYDKESGIMQRGLISEGDDTYFFGNDGKAVTGWHTEQNGDKYYFSQTDHTALKGIQNINGKEYCFASNGKMQTGAVLYPDGKYHFLSEGKQVSGFVKHNGATYYVGPNGTVLTGLQFIGDDAYYFSKTGAMLTGGYLINGKRYYFDVDTGKAISGFLKRENDKTYCYDGKNGVKKGLVEENGKLYYTNDDGIMQYGRKQVGDKYYYFDNTTGEAISGWREFITSSGTVYSFYYSPVDHAAVTGLQQIDGDYYLFSDSGYRLHGVRTVDDKTYLFDAATGKMQTGWYVSSSGYTHYYDGINGRISGNKCVNIDGKYYFFNNSGILCSGIRTAEDGTKMYFDPVSYELADGFVNADGKIYYSDGLNGLKSGSAIIDGNEYRFSEKTYSRLKGAQTVDDIPCRYDDNTGIRVTGWQYNSSNDKYYMYDENGRPTGFIYYGGVLYNFSNGIPCKGSYSESTNPFGFRTYFDPTTGEQQLGLITFTASNGNTYTFYYLEQGCITKDIDSIKQQLERFKSADGWHELEGLVYYVQNGEFAKGITNIEGKTYYFSKLSGAMLKGMRRIGSDLYYFSEKDGTMLTGWQTIKDKKFYFDPRSGKMLTGLQTIDRKTYCLLQGGGYATGTVMIGEDTYVFSKNDGSGTKLTSEQGKMPAPPANADSWVTNNGNKYYYAHNGKKLTGLQIIDKKLYLFDKNGKMLTGFYEVNGVLRYYTDDGVLLGFQTIDNDLYFFDSFGAALKDKIKVEDGKTYYFTKDGYAATGFCYVPEYFSTFYFDPDHTAHTGWLELDGKKYYYYPESDLFVPGTPAHGLTYVDGIKIAYFDYETACQQTGFIQVGLNKYMFFDEKTGYAVSGLKNCNGSLYLFSDEETSFGISLSGLRTIGNDTYYFSPDTQKAVSGFVTVGSNTYYFNDKYKMVTGLQTIDSKLYYFKEDKGYMRKGVFTIDGSVYCFGEDGSAVSGWYKTDSGDKYYFSETDHKAYTGMHIIDGEKYFFDTNGKSKTGLIKDPDGQYHYLVNEGRSTGFISYKGKTYYVDDKGCVLTGLQRIDGDTYYFSASGVMQGGFFIVDDKKYFFDLNTGKAVTGFIQRETGATYYFDGGNGEKRGLQKIDGKTYYLSEAGIVVCGRQKVGDSYYYFDTHTGEALSGWKKFAFSNGEWYMGYFSPKDLKAVTGGLKKIGSKYYYFSDYGYTMSGSRKVDGVTLYFDPVTFELYTGHVTINGKVYYSDGLNGIKFDKTAQTPENANSWGTVNGKKCYYDINGKPVTGMIIIDKKLYMFDDKGVLMTGLISHEDSLYMFTENGAQTDLQKSGNNTYYFSPSDATAQTGLKVISDVKYYFDTNGKNHTGWTTLNPGQKCYFDSKKGMLPGLQKIGGKTYWFGTNGIMRTGVVTVTDDNNKQMICCFDDDGAMVHGLIKTNGEWYYYDDTTGERVTGWKTVNGSTYYFNDSTGAALKGRRIIDNYNYYFDQNTAVKKLGVVRIGKYFYCFSDSTADGLTHGLTKIDGELYYFSETTGTSQIGSLSLNDVYYYFSEETGASVEGVRWINSSSAYYFEKNGGVRKGLQTYEGKQYYCYPSSGKVTTGLCSIGDKLYFFGDDGAMMKNTTVEICGITYSIDDNGYVSVLGDSKLAKMIRSGIEKLGTAYLDETVELDDEIDPTTAYHCSSFVTKELSDIGIFVKSIAYRQYHLLTHSDSYDVEYVSSFDDMKPGDIIYVSILKCSLDKMNTHWNQIDHVMMYLGNGIVIHSTSSEYSDRKGVNIAVFNNKYDYAFPYAILRLSNNL